MSTDSPGNARVAASLAVGLFFALSWGASAGCKRSAPPPTPATGSGAPPAPSVALTEATAEGEEAPARCRRLEGYAMTLDAPPAAGASPTEPGDAEPSEDDALLPFGVELGTAAPLTSGFAVSGISGPGQAFVALVGERRSRRVELGQLHGDVEAPAIASLGESAIVALRSSDAAGFTIKLARVPGFEGAVEWGYELTKLGKFVSDLELVATATRGVLVFQSEDKSGPRLMLGSFSTAALREPLQVKPLEIRGGESPRLLPRAGGFWLTWISILSEPKKAPKRAATEGDVDPEEAPLLEVGSRVVEVAKLDEQAKLLGAPLRIGEPRAQVLLYDVAALASGGLLLATRSDSAAPGAEGGALQLTEVGADGTVSQSRVDDDELGAGSPVLLDDPQAAAKGPWLTMGSESDATRLGLARGEKTKLQPDASLGRAQVLAVSGGRVLVQRARGRSVSLEALDCAALAESPAKQ